MRRWLLFAGPISLVFCVALVGCALGPAVRRTSESLDTDAKSFALSTGRANIYVCRKTEFVGSGLNISIILDGERVGALSIGTYLLLSVPPESTLCQPGCTNKVTLS